MNQDPYLEPLRAALSRAYAPYSNFSVGAVVRAQSGELYSGTNLENAAYPEGLCAEACAIAAMVMAGEQRLIEVAVMARGEALCSPCGGCRQKIAEFALPDTSIRLYSPDALRAVFSLAELLPYSFTPDHLN